jgi:hypothetical protein
MAVDIQGGLDIGMTWPFLDYLGINSVVNPLL